MAKLKSVIGCEITANEIRAVEIAKENGAYKIMAMGYMPIEEGVVEEAYIRDSQKFVDAITDLISQGNFQTTDVAIGVNNENVLMRYATFPKVDNDKLRNMIFLQAQEFIPIPIQEMEVDFIVAGEKQDDDGSQQVNVMLIAARKQMLEGYINNFTSAKLQVQEIDSSVLAYCRAINDISNGARYGLVNLTDDVLTFIVVEGNEIIMVRSITITERNQKAVTNVFRGSRDKSYTEEDVETVKNYLMSETSSTISYYSMQNSKPIEKIYFIMNSPIAEDVVSAISSNIYVPIEVPTLYSDLQASSATNIGEYASCIGIAISSLEG
ncbi:MAG: pilus assembly protein PilM [Clostridia bacterium]|nr:pilus assembly protein PilM [Clostridia bacterium]